MAPRELTFSLSKDPGDLSLAGPTAFRFVTRKNVFSFIFDFWVDVFETVDFVSISFFLAELIYII